MLAEYITSLADVSLDIVRALQVLRFRYSGKNLMRFVVFDVFLWVLRFSDPPYALFRTATAD